MNKKSAEINFRTHLAMVVKGYYTKEVFSILSVSESTRKGNIRNITQHTRKCMLILTTLWGWPLRTHTIVQCAETHPSELSAFVFPLAAIARAVLLAV